MMANYNVADCLCLSLRRSARLLTQHYDEALRPAGLRVTQFQLLATIGVMGPTAHQPLADQMGMDRTTLTRNLVVLEREGLVRLGTARGDRRSHEIGLTAAGRRALKKANELWAAAHEGTVKKIEEDGALPRFAEVLETVRRLGGAK